MPRFVILEHDHPELHWDLLLEVGEVLRTWRLAQPPMAGVPVNGQQLGDHRKLYLDYEGPVSGNRGNVVRWDSGSFTFLTQEDDWILVQLAGERVRGVLQLRRDTGDNWSGTWTTPSAGSLPAGEGAKVRL